MTGELIAHTFDGGGLLRELRDLRADVERLKLSGWSSEGGPSPGALLSAAQAKKIEGIQTFSGAATSILLGNATQLAVDTNEVVGRTGSGGVDGIPIAAQSVLGRAASGIEDFTASASQILARLSTGDLGFSNVATWAADAGVLTGAPWPIETVTGSVTLGASTILAILNHTADTTITLPQPTASGKIVIVADPHGKITASTAEVRFATSGGSDTINGATGSTTYRSTPYLAFIFVARLVSGPIAHWTGRMLNVAA